MLARKSEICRRQWLAAAPKRDPALRRALCPAATGRRSSDSRRHRGTAASTNPQFLNAFRSALQDLFGERVERRRAVADGAHEHRQVDAREHAHVVAARLAAMFAGVAPNTSVSTIAPLSSFRRSISERANARTSTGSQSGDHVDDADPGGQAAVNVSDALARAEANGACAMIRMPAMSDCCPKTTKTVGEHRNTPEKRRPGRRFGGASGRIPSSLVAFRESRLRRLKRQVAPRSLIVALSSPGGMPVIEPQNVIPLTGRL